ncbi:MAG: helix-turn-helix domain-containing protein [Actinomycetota bacterium]
MASLRERNRLNAMRLTQRRALDLFEERGFDQVTVSELAAEVGMAASTIYRHFETKEAIVIWDEHEPALVAALEEAFERLPPLAAMRSAFVTALGDRYEEDLEFQLRRVRFIYRAEALHAAAVEADYHDREELTAALAALLSTKDREAAPLLAGAALLAVDVAIDRWQQLDGVEPLGPLIDAAFDRIGNLDAIR